MIHTPVIDYGVMLPMITPAIGAMLILVLGAALRLGRAATAALALLTVGVSGGLVLPLWDHSRTAFTGMLVGDDYFVYLSLLLLFVVAVSIFISAAYVEREALEAPEYYALLLFVTTGGLLLLAAANLLTLLLGLEILSLGLYVLTGYSLHRRASGEAAMKYFLLGAFSVGFMIYGIALLYGGTGSLSYSGIAGRLGSALASRDGLVVAGVALLLVGLSFKLSLVPFHMWTPDVYTGAPTSVTAFMSVATKVAAFGALLRLLLVALPRMEYLTSPLLAGLAVATMIWGNLAAVVQRDIKRMLAYSSIGQAGYVLVAVIAGERGRYAAVFYLTAYVVTNLGAFATVLAAGNGGDERLAVGSYAGLGRERPVLAALLSAFLLSLAGVPPTVGFWGKLFAFRAAVDAGYWWLALVGVLTSAVAAYYYIRIVVLMYMTPKAEPRVGFRVPAVLGVALLVTVALVVVLGIAPDLFSGFLKAAMYSPSAAALAR